MCAFELLTDITMTAVHKCGGTYGGGASRLRESWKLQGSPVERPLATLSRGKQCSPSRRVIKCYELAVNFGQLSLKGPTWLSSFSCQILNLND